MSINTEKILKELAKGEPLEQHQSFLLIKDFVTKSLIDEAQKKENELNDLVLKAEKIKNN